MKNRWIERIDSLTQINHSLILAEDTWGYNCG
jgi:hypothetical protein